jgi:NAD(P)-dependent dehydrogenase (short-subunit alcohol dehydrogenase family)
MSILNGKTAVIYGGGGAIGGAVARAFADAGAVVHVATRKDADVLDARAVAEHAAALGEIDIALNAAAFPYRAAPLADLTVDELMHPIEATLRSNLNVAKAVAPHLRPGGALLTLSTAGARFARPGNIGYGTACAALEQLTQRLAAELGPSGVRAVCLRSHAIPDAHGSYTAEVFAPLAAASGITVEALLTSWGEHQTLLGRLPALAQIADAAVFLASDRAATVTGAVIDLTCGSAIRAPHLGNALVGVLD